MRKHHWLLIAAGILVFSSCQKSYNPPDLVISGGGSGGGSTSTGARLVKSESQTVGSSESSSTSFEYDASGHVSKITMIETDSSNKTANIWYNYTRDAAGKVTKITSNLMAAVSPGAGFPDTLTYTVHYPSGSSNFDYARYSYTLAGIEIVDSLAFVYSGNTITDTYEYQRFAGIPGMFSTRIQYGYNNGNVSSQKLFDSTGTNVLAIYAYEYDSKTAALNTGNDAFLPGMQPAYACKNNPTKASYNTAGGSLIMMVTYTLQYNSLNQPSTASALIMPRNQTVNEKFTYQ